MNIVSLWVLWNTFRGNKRDAKKVGCNRPEIAASLDDHVVRIAHIKELMAVLSDLYGLVRKQGMDDDLRNCIQAALGSTASGGDVNV